LLDGPAQLGCAATGDWQTWPLAWGWAASRLPTWRRASRAGRLDDDFW